MKLDKVVDFSFYERYPEWQTKDGLELVHLNDKNPTFCIEGEIFIASVFSFLP
jgi:hypothetical protein